MRTKCKYCNKTIIQLNRYIKKFCSLKCYAASKLKCDISILLRDNPQVYYWIGFLLADGCLVDRTLQFELCKNDQEQVVKFKEFIKYRGNRQLNCFAVTHDDVMKIKTKFGLSNNKTYNPPKIDIFEKMENDLFLSLLIGFIDGDGSIYSNSQNKKYLCLELKSHGNWKYIFEYFSIRLQTISKIKLKGSQVTLTKKEYARFAAGNLDLLQFLKRKTIKLNLPVLKRKWDKINLNYTNQNQKLETKVPIIIKLYKGGYSIDYIKRVLKTSYVFIVSILKKENLYKSEKERIKEKTKNVKKCFNIYKSALIVSKKLKISYTNVYEHLRK